MKRNTIGYVTMGLFVAAVAAASTACQDRGEPGEARGLSGREGFGDEDERTGTKTDLDERSERDEAFGTTRERDTAGMQTGLGAQGGADTETGARTGTTGTDTGARAGTTGSVGTQVQDPSESPTMREAKQHAQVLKDLDTPKSSLTLSVQNTPVPQAEDVKVTIAGADVYYSPASQPPQTGDQAVQAVRAGWVNVTDSSADLDLSKTNNDQSLGSIDLPVGSRVTGVRLYLKPVEQDQKLKISDQEYGYSLTSTMLQLQGSFPIVKDQDQQVRIQVNGPASLQRQAGGNYILNLSATIPAAASQRPGA